MERFCTMQIIKYTKKPNTKTVWIEIVRETKDIDRQTYDHIVAASPFFRHLGGSETITRAYTQHGYLPVEIVSTSPDKQDRTRRVFDL